MSIASTVADVADVRSEACVAHLKKACTDS